MKYKNFAFISYSHKNMFFAKWLQHKLESFKLPSEIHNDIKSSKYLRPVVRDLSDFNTGILNEEILEQLKQSKFLILICSKYSAQSKYVSAEAKAFVEMGRLDRIIIIFVPKGGLTEKDLLPQSLREYFEENPDKELLGLNRKTLGREKVLIKVISKMLGVSFDSLWNRHLRQKRRRILCFSTASVFALFFTYIFAVPVTLLVKTNMQKSNLPVSDRIEMNAEGGLYTTSLNTPEFQAISIPGYRRFSNLPIHLDSEYFIPIDTSITLGVSKTKTITFDMFRDDTFALYKGQVTDMEGEPIQDVKVSVADRTATTNSEGEFEIRLPLDKQKIEQPIKLEKNGYETFIREDEPPGEAIIYNLMKL